MILLEERVRRDGIVREGGVLKVDSFLNHQMDIRLFEEMGKEFARLFAGENVNKILTIEASGIGIACLAAREFGCPVVFAKKSRTINIAGDVWTSRVESFTHGRTYDIIVSKDYLTEKDRVLIIDDFLANGNAVRGMTQIVEELGAKVVGVGIGVEKGFQSGGQELRESGIDLMSLAVVKEIRDGSIILEDD